MADVQRQFQGFHDTIRRVDDQDKRDKRDILVAELRRRLPQTRPAFNEFNQGSYAMHTRIVPLTGDDDIDVGLHFDGTSTDLGCPVELKRDIMNALTHEGRTVNVRRPCVTVQYIKDGKPDYHVDLAVYADGPPGSTHLELARGKIGSAQEHRSWDASDPKVQRRIIRDAFPDNDAHRDQFRRCIRYLKRWRDERYGANLGPTSIALTCAAVHHFVPVEDPFSGLADDRAALRDLVSALAGAFVLVHDPEVSNAKRLVVRNVAYPHTDLLATTSTSRHVTFHQKLERLLSVLDDAHAEPDPVKACKLLRDELGGDFPVPTMSQTAKAAPAPVVRTGRSA